MTTDDLEQELRGLRPQPLTSADRLRIRASVVGVSLAPRQRFYQRFAAAAAILLLVGGGIFASLTIPPPISPINQPDLAMTASCDLLTVAQLQGHIGNLTELTDRLDAYQRNIPTANALSTTSFIKELP